MKRTGFAKSNHKSNFALLTTLVCLAIFGFMNPALAQTTIYSTDFGTVANVNPVGWTFNGIGMNISTNNASSGYAGASGSACLGEGNSGSTFINTSGVTQTSSPVGTSEAILMVSTSGYSNVALSFGLRKSSAGYDANATYTLSWSTNGTAYTQVVYSEPTAGNWGLASGAGLSLPLAAANQPSLYIKWTFVRTGASSNYKIDDVILTGNIPTVTPATISFLSNDTTVMESSALASIYLKLNATSTQSSAVTVTVSALSNASAADYTLAVATVTFAANAPVNSTAPVIFNINNDAIIESSEYIILRIGNPQNVTIGTVNQFALYIADNDKVVPAPSNAIALNLLSSFSNGVSGSNSAEIVAHDPTTQRLYIANSIGAKLDIVDFVNPSGPTLLYSIPVTPYGNINSIAVRNGIVAAAIENSNPQDSGKVVFFDQNGTFLKSVKVGMMPDMITFNHAGTKVITANEGEPNATYTVDPDGSVSIVDISGGIAALTQTNVAHVTFTVYNGQEATLRSQGIRIYGLGANASKDFEPEYVSVSKDDSKAWVTLQENNAIVEINLATNAINSLKALGTKDHALLNNGFDASNVTGSVNIANFKVKGLYLPDAIASYTVGGVNYLITANEGDSRAYSGFSEEQRISAASVTLDPVKFPNAAEMKNNSVLGRLNITDKTGDIDNDGDLDTLYSYGSRSFSIWNASTGNLVYDSKDDLESITSTNSFSVMFNASNANNTKKDRSDDKGPEPEGVTIGTIGSSIYAFIALERIGGVMVYDVTNPNAPVYVTYVNNRVLPGNGPDLGSEGIIFIPQSQSPNGQHLVIAANEVSSTLSIWGIAGCVTPISSSLSVSSGTATICSNNLAAISVPSVTGLTYQWSNGAGAISGATLNALTPTVSGSYSVAINGGANCSTGSLTRSLTVVAAPVLTITGSAGVCAGSAVSQTVSGAATYSWNSGPTTSVVSLSPSSTTGYTVTGTANGCASTLSKTITVNALPVLTVAATSTAICAGQSATLTASGAATYSWTGFAATNTLAVNPTGTSSYSVVGTSTDNCSSTQVNTLTVNQNPTVSVSGTTVICSGQTTTLTASGAATYSWSNSNATNTTAVTPASSVNYSVTGTSTANCSSTLVQSVTVNPTPTVSVSGSTVFCSGASSTLTASGAATYSWNTTSTTNTILINPASSVSYSVTGTSTANCSSTKVQSVTVNPTPTVSVSGNTVICAQQSTSLTASGASTYSWSTGITTNTISILTATTDTFTVTGISTANCSASVTKTVIVNPLPVLSVSGNTVACVGTPLSQTVTGANTYAWGGPAVTGTGSVVTLMPSANAVYTITGTSNGCSSSILRPITTSLAPNLNISGANVSCGGAAVSQTVSGASTYSWSNGATTAVVALTPAGVTSYTAYGVNVFGCASSVVKTLSVSALPVVNVSSTSTLVCEGETATLSVTGASTYSWSNGSTAATFTVIPAVATVYTVTGTTADNCSASAQITQSVSACTSLKELQGLDTAFNIYPNPSNGDIRIDVSGAEHYTVNVINALGSVVLTVENYETNATIDVSALTSGIYFVQVSSGSKQAVKKLIID